MRKRGQTNNIHTIHCKPFHLQQLNSIFITIYKEITESSPIAWGLKLDLLFCFQYTFCTDSHKDPLLESIKTRKI